MALQAPGLVGQVAMLCLDYLLSEDEVTLEPLYRCFPAVVHRKLSLRVSTDQFRAHVMGRRTRGVADIGCVPGNV